VRRTTSGRRGPRLWIGLAAAGVDHTPPRGIHAHSQGTWNALFILVTLIFSDRTAPAPSQLAARACEMPPTVRLISLKRERADARILNVVFKLGDRGGKTDNLRH
jgi:hypothetical protein